MVPAHSHKVSRVSWYSGSCWAAWDFGYGAFTLSGGTSQSLLLSYAYRVAVRTPQCTHRGLGSFAFARRYLRNRCFFLFLRLLRCFSSPGSPPYVMDWRMDTGGLLQWVSPFRYLRIVGYLLLPEAFRSLSRLSSALSAKASALRPFLLNLLLDLHEMKRNETRPTGLPDRTVELLFMEWTRYEAPLAILIEDPQSGSEIVSCVITL